MTYYKTINGKTIFFNGMLKKDGKQIINPQKNKSKQTDGWSTNHLRQNPISPPTKRE